MAEATNQNTAGEVAPSTVDKQAPSISEETSADKPAKAKPDPKATAAKAAEKPQGDEPTAKTAKKEKPPAVEDKPFAEFIQQHYLPALKTALQKQDLQDLELTFEKQKIQVIGFSQEPECWQVIGRWYQRQFRIYFLEENIQGQRGFSYATNGSKSSTLESFLIDERKITLDLLVFGAIQRLNAQKWLARN